MRRMRSCSSPATRCTAASAERPPRITSRDALQPAGIGGDQAIGVEHVARGRSVYAGGKPVRHAGDQLVEALLHPVRPRRAAAPVPSPDRPPAAGYGRRWLPCITTGPIAIPATSVAPAKNRGTVPPTPSCDPSDAPLAAQHLGQQHRDGLQLLHFLRGIKAAGCGSAPSPRPACARRVAPARPASRRTAPRRFPADRRRPDGSARPAGSSPGRGGAQSDDALAHAQPGAADGLRIESLGRHEFQHVTGPRGVDRAHLAHEFGRRPA